MSENGSSKALVREMPEELRLAFEELRTLEADILMERLRFSKQHGLTFNGARDEYVILGYDTVITNKQYRVEYERGGIAGRIIDALPNATWRGKIELIENEDPKTNTPFEQSYKTLDARLGLQSRFLRVDKMSSLSHYAVLFIGGPGNLEGDLPKGKGNPDDIKFVSIFSGGSGPGNGPNDRASAFDADCMIEAFDVDPTSERFGLPKSYQLKRTDISSPMLGTGVHWSRIIHVAQDLLDNEVYGLPGLERVWNDLINIRKIVGGGAEAFWLRANQGFHINVDKDQSLTDPSLGLTELKAQIEKYKHGLDRWIRTKGTDVNVLGSDVANFSQSMDACLTLIAGAKAIPKRILTGSEMGELASSQDRDNWQDQVNGRQTGHAEPNILRAFVNRLLAYNYLPVPKGKGHNGYDVRWSPISKLSQAEKNAMGTTWASINSTMGETVFTRDEIREATADKGPLTADQMKQIEEEKAKKMEEQQAMFESQAKASAAAKGITDDKNDKKNSKEKKKSFPQLKAAEGSYSHIEVVPPKRIQDAVLALSATISEEDLAEKGREDHPHVTVKYGLLTNRVADVENVVQNFPAPLRVTLGKLNAFAGPDFDVLYFEVDSPDLEKLNAHLTERLACAPSDYLKFVPHLTVAYLKPGLAGEFVGEDVEEVSFETDQVIFNPADGESKVLDFGLRAAENEELVRVLEAAILSGSTEVIENLVGMVEQ